MARTSEGASERERFQRLDRAYIGARYRKDFIVFWGEVDYLAPRVKQLLDVTEAICRKRIGEMCSRIDAGRLNSGFRPAAVISISLAMELEVCDETKKRVDMDSVITLPSVNLRRSMEGRSMTPLNNRFPTFTLHVPPPYLRCGHKILPAATTLLR